MRRVYLFVGLLLVGGLIGLWAVNRQRQPEVITIYKVTPYEPKRVNTPQIEHRGTPLTQTQISEEKYARELQTDKVADDSLLGEEGISDEAEMDFEKWFAPLEAEPSAETTDEETEEAESEDTTTEIPYRELRDMVVAGYELEDVLNEYGVFPDTLGKSACPKCPSTEFVLMKYTPTGRHEKWCCMDCKDGAYNVIEFVAWMEGTDDHRGVAMRLAERANLLE